MCFIALIRMPKKNGLNPVAGYATSFVWIIIIKKVHRKKSLGPKVDMVNWTDAEKELRTAGGSKTLLSIAGLIHIGIVFQIPPGFTPRHQIYKTLRVTKS